MPMLDRRFYVFSKIWSIGTVFHLLSFYYWFVDSPVIYSITFLFVILNLVYPIRNVFFFSGLAGMIALVWFQLPIIPNHIFFEWFINILFVSVAAVWMVWAKGLYPLGSYFFGKTFYTVRWSVVILYFYVVLHKLNYDFYDPYISCGAVLFEDIFKRSNLFSIDLIRDFYYRNEFYFGAVSVYFTLISEAMIPLMLIIRRWRNAGIIFGVLFHFILSFHGHNGIFSFSALMYTMFVFFWSDHTVASFYDFWNLYRKRINAVLLITLSAVLIIYLSLPGFYYVLATLLCFYGYSVVYFVRFYKSVRSNLPEVKISMPGMIQPRFAWIIPLVIAINGFAPYLGLKTETSFSMFSNLRTEGNVTNHQFIPTSWQIFDYQKKLVRIIKSDYEKLQNLDLYHNESGVQLVMFEFVKILNNSPDNIYVEFEVNGVPGVFEKQNGNVIKSDVDLYEHPVLKKFFNFRIVHDKKSLCRH